MAYRVRAVDAADGRPRPPYDSAARSMAEVFAEARQKGLRVLSMQPLGRLQPAGGDAPRSEFDGRNFRWRLDAAELMRLAREHPNDGERSHRVALVAVPLLASKLGLLAVGWVAASLLAVFGFSLEPLEAVLVLLPLVALLPIALAKGVVLPGLRHRFSAGGMDSEQRLRIVDAQIEYFDGKRSRELQVGRIAEISDLPSFVLLRWREVWEVAMPKRAFASAEEARRFIQHLAAAASVEPRWEVRTAWQSGPVDARTQRSGLIILAVAIAVVGAVWLGFLWMLLGGR